ncbi:MAG TPA: hypothetical protein VND65_14925 [Candidatus Binatia bacterium]|nr:hypothetical protein [Candidatus Binatia bacterium]
MPDNILRVGAEFDVAPLVAGAQQAGASFEQLKARLLQLAAEAEAVGNTVQAQAARMMSTGMSAEETASALANLGISAKKAAEATAAVGAAAGITAPELQRVAAAATNAAGSTQRLASAMGAARVEAGVFTGSTGMMVGGLARVAAANAALAPIIQAAFPVFAAVALIDILSKIPGAIESIVDALAGWDKEAQKTYDDLIKDNMRLVESAANTQIEIKNLNQIGKEGMEKFSVATKDNAENLKMLGLAAADNARQLAKVTEEYEKMNTIAVKAIALQNGQFIELNKTLKDHETAIKNLSALREFYDKRQRDLMEQQRKEMAEAGAEGVRLGRERTASEISSAETIGRARISAEEKTISEMRALNMIDADGEARLRSDTEERLFAIERGALERRIALFKSEGSVRTSDVVKTQAELQALEITHQSKMQSIMNTAALEDKRREEQRKITAIETEQTIINAADRESEAFARLAVSHAETPTELRSAELDLEQRITRAYNDQIEALRQRAEVLAATDPLANEKEIAELNAKIVALDADRDTAILTLRSDTTERIKTMNREEVDDFIRGIHEQQSTIEATYRDDITALQELYTEKKLTLSEYTAAAKSFADQEYRARIANIDDEVAALKNERDRDLITEENYAKRLQDLATARTNFEKEKIRETTNFQKEEDAKREAEYKAATDKMATAFTQGFDKILTTNQKLGTSFAQLGREIELELINRGIKNVVTHYGEEFAKILATHLNFITQFITSHSTFLATLLGLEATNDAAKVAKTIAANTAVITSEAGVSYAGGFASVMAALPFPLNVSTAPGVAAAAAGETEAGALAFAKGGIVPAALHEGEMVLPPTISAAVQGAIPAIQRFNTTMSSTVTGGSATSTTNHYHDYRPQITIHQHGDKMSVGEITAAVRRGMRLGH